MEYGGDGKVQGKKVAKRRPEGRRRSDERSGNGFNLCPRAKVQGTEAPNGRLGVKLQKGRKERATVVRQRLASSPYFSEEAALSRWCVP